MRHYQNTLTGEVVSEDEYSYAKDLGRKAVLIEREEKYCEIAARRMGQEVLAL